MIKAGDKAPDFTALADTGEPLSLRDFRGHVVVLYFYPKDNTPGCTTEACAFRDDFPRFQDMDAIVLGVSPDSAVKHRNFKAKHRLPFTLVADTDHAIADAYGVWGQKSMFGRKYWGVLRTTFVIDAKGKVARVFSKVNPMAHTDEVAEAVDSAS